MTTTHDDNSISLPRNNLRQAFVMTRHPSSSLLLHLRILLNAVILLAFTQGCATNLKAIQDFANLSAESAEYTTLVDEYIEFPARQKRYQPPNRHAGLETMAQERATQKPALLLRQSIVETYMNSLGRLAADELVDNTEELAQLSAALQNQAGTNPQDTEAYGKIAGILTKVCHQSMAATSTTGPYRTSKSPDSTHSRGLRTNRRGRVWRRSSNGRSGDPQLLLDAHDGVH